MGFSVKSVVVNVAVVVVVVDVKEVAVEDGG